MKCSKCDAENHDSATFCKKCGGSFMPDSMCKKCETINEEDAVFCVKCGDNLIENKTVIHEKLTDTTSKFIPKQNKKRKTGIIIGVASVAIIIIALLTVFVVRPQMLRSQVDKYIESMQFTRAQTTYEKLPNYMHDDTEYLYISLLADFEKGNYVAATGKLVKLGGYKDAAGLLDKADGFIRMIADGGIKLTPGEVTKISDKIESIAEQAVKEATKTSNKKESITEQTVKETKYVGTWTEVKFYSKSDKNWHDYNSDIWKKYGIPDRRTVITFKSDRTYQETMYESIKPSELQEYQDMGYTWTELYTWSEVAPTSAAASWGETAYRFTSSDKWRTEGDNMLIKSYPSVDGTSEEVSFSCIFDGNTLTLSQEDGGSTKQYERQ